MPVPEANPVTRPVEDTGINVLLLLQVPPPVTSLNCEVCPTHMDVLPVIVAGIGLTVIVFVV